MHALLNNTKWDELRLAMYGLGKLAPRWRTFDLENGYLSEWDKEWFYHFSEGGYQFIQWVEIATDSVEQNEAVYRELVRIHLPGEKTPNGFRIFGYAEPGAVIDYIGSRS